VRNAQTTKGSPLQIVRQMRHEDGSSLPMDKQLCCYRKPKSILALPNLRNATELATFEFHDMDRYFLHDQ
jgi:hypothetical protein